MAFVGRNSGDATRYQHAFPRIKLFNGTLFFLSPQQLRLRFFSDISACAFGTVPSCKGHIMATELRSGEALPAGDSHLCAVRVTKSACSDRNIIGRALLF